jgi:hypothetical protein
MASELSEVIAAMITERGVASRAEWERKQAAKKAFRAERKKARDAGLRLRHAAKLARGSAG